MAVGTHTSVDLDNLELLRDFVHDAGATLREVEPTLVALRAREGAEPDGEALDRILRVFHSLNGGASFLELTQVERVTAEAASLLEVLRGGRGAIEPSQVELLLATTDFLRTVLDRVVSERSDRTCLPAANRLVLELGAAARGEPPEAEAPAASAEDAEDATHTIHPPPPLPFDPQPAAGTLRIEADRLDKLMTLVDELTEAGADVAGSPDLDGLDLPMFREAAARLQQVTRAVRDVAAALSSVPIGSAFKRLPRVIRDVARRVGKSVDVVVTGEATGVSRVVAEQLKDPLLHLVRNAVDHGVELADVRAELGKPEMGTVRIEAFREAEYIRVSVSDDGAGLDRERILERALELDLVAPDQAWRMRDVEVFELTCVRGLSTVTQITELSGRGIGMDLVKRDIEALGGRVEGVSEPGGGTTWVLWIPAPGGPANDDRNAGGDR